MVCRLEEYYFAKVVLLYTLFQVQIHSFLNLLRSKLVD